MLQYRAAMPPATECRVHVPAIRTNAQPFEDLVQEDWYVLFVVHSTGSELKGKRLQLRRQIRFVLVAEPFIPLLVPPVFVP